MQKKTNVIVKGAQAQSQGRTRQPLNINKKQIIGSRDQRIDQNSQNMATILIVLLVICAILSVLIPFSDYLNITNLHEINHNKSYSVESMLKDELYMKADTLLNLTVALPLFISLIWVRKDLAKAFRIPALMSSLTFSMSFLLIFSNLTDFSPSFFFRSITMFLLWIGYRLALTHRAKSLPKKQS